MQPWKAIALIVPAGLVLGMAAGAANRPVMIDRATDYWPASVEEKKLEIEPYRPIYEAGPQDLAPVRYSYRPELDYSAYAWPDQSAPEPVILQADYGDPAPRDASMPVVHRGSTDLAAERAAAAAQEALSVARAPATAPSAAGPFTAPARTPQAQATLPAVPSLVVPEDDPPEIDPATTL